MSMVLASYNSGASFKSFQTARKRRNCHNVKRFCVLYLCGMGRKKKKKKKEENKWRYSENRSRKGVIRFDMSITKYGRVETQAQLTETAFLLSVQMYHNAIYLPPLLKKIKIHNIINKKKKKF